MAIDERRPFHNKIFFCDIVGYSRLDPVQQYQCQRSLTKALQSVVAGMGLVLERDAIALPTGDGVALNFLAQEPDLHLRTATHLLRMLHEAAVANERTFDLRIGLNSHVDTVVFDINGKPNIVGHGINYAQRVMDLGRHRQILMHDCVRHELESYPDYAAKIVYRGDYTVKHGKQIPIAQFVDPASPYLDSEPLAPPRSPAGPSIDLGAILRHHVQENLLQVSLDRRAQEHLDDIRDFITDFLDERGEFQQVKIAVTWIVSEMLDNAFRYGVASPLDSVLLRLARTTSGIQIEVEQPDVASFDLERVLCEDERPVSFMRLMDRRGMHWRHAREAGRLTLVLELPRALDVRPNVNLVTDAGAVAGRNLPDEVAAFLDEMTDVCCEERIRLVRVPSRRLDGATAPRLEELIDRHLLPACDLVLDMNRVTYVSSIGLRILMVAVKKSRAIGSRVVVANLTPVVKEIFEISNFRRLLPVYDGGTDAYWALQPASAPPS